MASTRCIRQGQIEIGIIEHEGHEYAAFGAAWRSPLASPSRTVR